MEDALRQELQLENGESIPTERLGEVEQLLVCGQTLMGTLQEHEDQVGFVHDRYAVATPMGTSATMTWSFWRSAPTCGC